MTAKLSLREIDARIAEVVMGEQVRTVGGEFRTAYRDVPEYSTDIAAAWTVVHKMMEDGYSYAITDTPIHSSFLGWVVFRRGASPPIGPNISDITPVIDEHSITTSICIAALAACGVEVEVAE